MAKPDVFGAAILELLRTTEQPLLMTEVAEQVGCSKARAYAWLEANRGLVVAVSRKGRGGAAYLARDNVHRVPARNGGTKGTRKPVARAELESDSRMGGPITIGSRLLIVSMGLADGHVVLELRGDSGEMVSATIQD